MKNSTPTSPVSTRRSGLSIPTATRPLELFIAVAFVCVVGCLPLSAASDQPTRGIAILASDIGSYYPVTSLQAFVQEGGFSSVIIDWAWITYHWDRTDF